MTYWINCYNFNNYYNRIVTTRPRLSAYGNPVYNEFNVNFNFGDGVDTSVVLNTNENPDYIILADNQGDINSRWFVIDSTYTRNGQHIFQLHRDVIADNFEEVVNAPAFIEKGTITDSSNPLLYQKEDMDLNQIKQSEDLIKDATAESGFAPNGWIVGYMASNFTQGITATINTLDIPADSYVNYSDIDDYLNTENRLLFSNSPELTLRMGGTTTIGTKYSYLYKLSKSADQAELISRRQETGYCKYYTYRINNVAVNNAFKDAVNGSNMLSVVNSYDNKYIADNLAEYNGKYVINNGITYKIKVRGQQRTATYDITMISDFGTTVQGHLQSAGIVVDNDNPINPDMKLTVSYLKQDLFLERVTLENSERLAVNFNTTLVDCSDAPYKLFTFPYSETNLRLAIEISKELGTNCYDIQLMPYCPVPERVNDEGWIPDPPASEYDKTATPIYYQDEQEIYGFIYFAEKSTFNIQIPYSVSIAEPKIEFNTDLYRLCSPNGGASFEFNPALNFGVDYFDVDCTYKPINPYIHINPNFKGLYGSDFNDYRGLIFNGDYSIPLITDKWREYEINNKNYQAIFNREIEHMDFTNEKANIQLGVQTGVGAVQGVVSGAAAGSLVAPGIGTAIGAIAGGAASLAGGIADNVIQREMQAEAIDYKKDLFGLQLGNIKALPNSISKTGCLTNNFKFFPYLEKYSCTEVEKQALRDKITYNGMKIGVIGRIADYANGKIETVGLSNDEAYVKGKLIRTTDIADDWHMVNAISLELDKGVFIK